MNQFTADIAGVLEIAVISAGIIAFYVANQQKSALLKSAALLMIVGGISVGLCTTYWWFKYYHQGAFDISIEETRFDERTTISLVSAHQVTHLRTIRNPIKKRANSNG